MKKPILDKIGYAIGYISGATILGCIMAILVALTIKIITFIL